MSFGISLLCVSDLWVLLSCCGRCFHGRCKLISLTPHVVHCSMEKPAEVDFHLIEFDDIRFHVQVGKLNVFGCGSLNCKL